MATVLICCDKFKGSATSAAVSKALGQGLIRAGHAVLTTPLADGGDGTLEAFESIGYKRETSLAIGSDGLKFEAQFSLNGQTAVIEIARICGLDLAAPEGTRPSAQSARQAGTWGVGNVIKSALEKGAQRIIIGLGGSATTDAGFGMAQALGVEFFDSYGSIITQVGDIGLVQGISLDHLDPRLEKTKFIVASDVRNPLCGVDGAAIVYGTQKGLSAEDAPAIDAAIRHFADVFEQALGLNNTAQTPGAGAAGGLGFMAMALLAADMRSGVNMILDETGGGKMLAQADLVITGEGCIDSQTLSGKAPAGIAVRARARGIPVVAVCGQNQLDPATSNELFENIYSLTVFESDVNECIRNPLPILEGIGFNIAKQHLS
ncbi:glycerate kinase [Corynebacterium crudilactis]|uniref:Glycerate kinase n=1 Tax=Corynebacterium crudilactis TaxID=1652495 RepID=A0A172QU30_9CORY|nr:glycerate kinase [Corynebacterium crudilactis]ANE04176.1 glycerate kinase [Corynebacterium crudilactis]